VKYWKDRVLSSVIGERKPGSVVLLFGDVNRKYKGCVTLNEIYQECKSEDGFLYCQFLTQATLKKLQKEQERKTTV
jgi:hypothetical protein